MSGHNPRLGDSQGESKPTEHNSYVRNNSKRVTPSKSGKKTDCHIINYRTICDVYIAGAEAISLHLPVIRHNRLFPVSYDSLRTVQLRKEVQHV